jgi:hypothetical protein
MSHSPLTPEAAAAAKTKCQCGHPRGIHCAVRNSVPKRWSLCRYCTCRAFIEGPFVRFPKYPHEASFLDRLPETIVGIHNVVCIDCGKRRRCVDGRICVTCCKEADEMVGLSS